MIFRNPLYAVGRIDGPVHARIPRAVQSSAAHDLATALVRRSHPEFIVSKSHSRACVAAVVATAAPGIAIGIDVEYMDSARPWREMFRVLLGDEQVEHFSAHDFYRGWTFAEAYFKAFSDWPKSDRIRDVLCGVQSMRHVGGQMELLHESIADNFLLCVVWQGFSGPAQRIDF